MKRWKRRRLSAMLCLTATPLLLSTPRAWAIDPYLPMLDNFYTTSGTRLDDCLVCHLTSNGGTRNSYGADFEAAKGGSTT